MWVLLVGVVSSVTEWHPKHLIYLPLLFLRSSPPPPHTASSPTYQDLATVLHVTCSRSSKKNSANYSMVSTSATQCGLLGWEMWWNPTGDQASCKVLCTGTQKKEITSTRITTARSWTNSLVLLGLKWMKPKQISAIWNEWLHFIYWLIQSFVQEINIFSLALNMFSVPKIARDSGNWHMLLWL